MTSTTSFHSALVASNRLLPGIHGLRGIAALAVVLFHTTHIAKIAVPGTFAFIAQDFGKGVHLFFVVSAFSLLHSTEPGLHRTSWATEYCIKRFFRIAPLFYLILAGMLAGQWIKSGTISIDLTKLLLNLTFTFGFAPWVSHVWGSWSIGVEMLFYALFPLLILTVSSSKGTLNLVIISILIAISARLALQTHFDHTTSLYKYNWSYFSFAPNICFFALGMYAYRLAQDEQLHSRASQIVIMASTSMLLLALLFLSKSIRWQPDLILWGCAFSALALWQALWPSRWCANTLFEYLGERSYSIYLLHPVIIYLLAPWLQTLYQTLLPPIGPYAFFACSLVVIVPLLFVAEFTYRLVEIPCIRLGQKINLKIRNIQLPAAIPGT